MADDSKIVKFNVGGTRYEVARSLLSSHPDTMLSRMASEQWQEDPDSEIFIERFQYCLDYLRDGKVLLPISTVKESILEDMTYYGIEVADEETVAYGKHDGVVTKLMVQNNQEVLEEIKALTGEMNELKGKLAMLLLAQATYAEAISIALKSSTGSLPRTIRLRDKQLCRKPVSLLVILIQTWTNSNNSLSASRSCLKILYLIP